MQKENEEFKQLVFDLMNDLIDTEHFPIAESEYVKNEFQKDTFCSKTYATVFHANSRLCKRLGVQEDPDVETIITGLLDIGQYLAKKMYDYGAFFSSPQIK